MILFSFMTQCLSTTLIYTVTYKYSNTDEPFTEEEVGWVIAGGLDSFSLSLLMNMIAWAPILCVVHHLELLLIPDSLLAHRLIDIMAFQDWFGGMENDS
jgi:hypothetical protein